MGDSDDEEVGYCRPPKRTRFRPGHSGNPAGRRKGARNVATALALELKTKIVVRENGHDLRVTKAEAMAKALILKALKGDTKAFGQIMAFLPEQSERSGVAEQEAEISVAEREALERFITRKVNERSNAGSEGVEVPATEKDEKGD